VSGAANPLAEGVHIAADQVLGSEDPDIIYDVIITYVFNTMSGETTHL